MIRRAIMQSGDYQAFAKCPQSGYVFILTLISSISKDVMRMGGTNYEIPPLIRFIHVRL